MATLPVVPLALKCVFSGTNTPSKWANILHVIYATGTPNAAILTTIANTLQPLFTGNLLLHVTSGVILTQVTVQDISANTGATGVWSGSVAGGVATTSLPASVAVAVSWKIARRYRGSHPRTYLTGIPTTAQQDGQTMTPGYNTNYNTDALNFRNGVSTMVVSGFTGFQLASISYFQGHVPGLPEKPTPRPTPVVDPIIGQHVDLRFDTQRRRLGKGRG